ncbi:MAG: ATP-dependent Clp protease ATP-binding subunit [Paludibacteraceae bacterium]|nr:ATP-dependent Clp protease ATP-binding subunit [Paludibacteraceae bacterium]
MEYTARLKTIISYAGQETVRLGNAKVSPEHLMLGILRLAEGTAYDILSKTSVKFTELKHVLDDHVRQEPPEQVENSTIHLSPAGERIVRLVSIERDAYGAEVAGSIHLLLAILRERINFVAQTMENAYGVTYEVIEEMYPKPERVMADGTAEEEEKGERQKSKAKSKSDTPALDAYGRDLTRMAIEGKLDPVVGREQEITRVLRILSRRRKNNPILLGDPGVGKSAIVEGLAERLIRTDVPELQNKRIISLDLAVLVAGTMYRGQFEERMKNVLQELRKHPEIILFIDEIHTLMGAGNGSGSLDAAGILKPALARGEVQCIGATTLAEYKKTIEKDGALERRFQKIIIPPTTADETVGILQQLAPYYSDYHHVEYSPEAIEACVRLSERYITDRAFPDKAIDVLDEAGALLASRSQNSEVGDQKSENQKSEVTDADIAEVVSIMSGVPVQRVATAESQRLRELDRELRSRVIGQDEAVSQVVKAIRRSRLGLSDPNRPIGSFFFLGPTGVGKTYLAQCLAEEMFGSKDALIRFDMSEYGEKHTASLMVGAPPGYVAHEEGGRLTEAVRRKPYSIILFDEIEKAHSDIFNVLLQMLDEGRLTDRQGHTVDFRNTIIIFTSNVGTRQLAEQGAGIGFESSTPDARTSQSILTKALNRTFPPEFVNRLDAIVFFHSLGREALERIVDIELSGLLARTTVMGYNVTITPEVREQIIKEGSDPRYGARPLRRAIQTHVEDVITEILLNQPADEPIMV